MEGVQSAINGSAAPPLAYMGSLVHSVTASQCAALLIGFQHIRKEFSLAYTKIVDAAYTKGDLPTGREIIDLICEPVSDEQSSS